MDVENTLIRLDESLINISKPTMNKHCARWTFNRKQLQSIISSFCGYYCCMFCMLRCRRVDITRIVNMFTTDTAFNDSIAHSFVCNKSF